MQSKGAIRFVAILLLFACLWQLSFSVVTNIYENKAASHADEVVALAQKADSAGLINKDSLAVIRERGEREYFNSIAKDKIYFGYTFKEIQAKGINLGLDLKGGMNVMLQVQLEDLVKALAKENVKDTTFVRAITAARIGSKAGEGEFLDLFANAWAKESAGKGKYLRDIFSSYVSDNKISIDASDAAVIEVIREEAGHAIDNSYNVITNRIDRFGVAQPSIQKVGNAGRILVELPGVKEPERVRKLLQGTASLEFWETYKGSELSGALSKAGRINTVDGNIFDFLQPIQSEGACLGYAASADTVKINHILASAEVRRCFPGSFVPMWSVKPAEGQEDLFELVAIKASGREGWVLDGDAVKDARVSYSDQRGSDPKVSMTMNAEGAKKWARITEQNIGRQVAIVLDGTVYSYPVVKGKIEGGQSEISGHFDASEATDLVNVLLSGKLPAPATIIQEQVVGPSLGAESIRAGLISFIIAFLLVLIYMIFFYKGAGIIADVALLTNVILLFGTLASFGAVLTLPGIAGLILTLGMAVDANVIIYERIKEELKAGKGLGKAVADGYSNAYSAIIDGQITTILTGIVLFFFGSGPIKGFATTLVIGIVTSVLTSIFITRLIIDDRLVKGKNVTFESNFTKNFLKNTNIDFIKGRKWSYIVSGTLIVIALVSIFAKGFTYGVDFTGGRTYVVRFDKTVNVEDARKAILNAFDERVAEDNATLKEDEPTVDKASVEVKQFGEDNQIKVATSYRYKDESAAADSLSEATLYTALSGMFANEISVEQFIKQGNDKEAGIISSEKVSPSIAEEVKSSAVVSVLLALLVIFAYIAFRFKRWTWGLGGVVSLAHTTIIIIGFFSLFSGILPFNLDVDQTFIAAILTIIGYAINDNVVIFDRIRENLKLHPNADFKETVNKSLNATLTRTVNTSVSTLLPMLAIAIWGGESIRGLAVALILGILFGTYASIMIGTPVMFDSTRKSNAKKAAKASK